MKRRILYVVIAFVILGVIGASQQPKNPPTANVASSAPEITAEVTLTPTKKPTPAPTINTSYVRWTEFGAHVIEVARGYGTVLSLISNDTSDFYGWAESLEPTKVWANEEMAWLAANPPEPCYVSTYNTWKAGINEIAEAIPMAQAGAQTFTVSLVSQATSKISLGTAYIEQAKSTIAKSNAACQ